MFWSLCICHLYRLLILIVSFHLTNSLWSLKFVWKLHNIINYFIVLRFLFPSCSPCSYRRPYATMVMVLLEANHSFLCAFRKNKEPSEVDDAEDKCENMNTIENGIPCDPLDMKGGHINDAFMTEDERLTPLWRAVVLLPQEIKHLFLCDCWASWNTKSRSYILFHHSSFVINFECAWNWKAINYTHKHHWNHKLLATQNILKYFSDNIVYKCGHVVFVVIDLSIFRNKIRTIYIFSHFKDLRKNKFSSGEYI